MRVLITGGAGFLGSHLAERLADGGDSVWAIDNFATGTPRNLSQRPEILLREGSILDRALLRGLMEEAKPEVVVHAAASYKDPENWESDAQTNVVGTANVVQEARRLRTHRLIYLQTALCYGLKPRENPITLSHPLNPGGSSYAITKTAGEHFVLWGAPDPISFRLANVYGPRNISGPLPTFYQRLTAGKPCFVMDTRRDFVYVDDLVDVLASAVHGGGRSGVYHVSSGADYSIQELFEGTVEALGIKLDKPVEVRSRNPDDAFSILLDPSRTREDFGWKARVPLVEGVKRAIAWYREHGVEITYTHLKLSKS